MYSEMNCMDHSSFAVGILYERKKVKLCNKVKRVERSKISQG